MSQYPRRPVDEEELLNCIARIIESLRHERNTERKSHQRTQDICEARLCAREAQLCRCEAELEAYVGVPTSQHGVFQTPELQPLPLDVMTDDEAIRMLEKTATRNRELEVEIKTLFKRLDQARSAASPPPRFPSSETAQRCRPPPQDDESRLPDSTNRLLDKKGEEFTAKGNKFSTKGRGLSIFIRQSIVHFSPLEFICIPATPILVFGTVASLPVAQYLKGREVESGEATGRDSSGEQRDGVSGESMDKELDGVLGLLGEAGVALGEVRAGLEELDRS